MIGTKLGPYEITAKLGEGGMGEVYRATDTKLRRDVAIKVLPAAFTEDKERLARFEREAQLLAQLHHPNIASIFGLEESDDARALVMELVEGPTLAERLETGALPFEEVLSIAVQIAQALEAAHDKGIVHRDLKPQNVKVSSDGTVKVLDFGLAKAMDPAANSTSAADLARSPTLLNSPTLTAVQGTQLGVILGTAAYMAPEQARGAAVDKRADIWAFGVVLHEMLVGRSLFAADTVTDTLAGVLKTEIDLAELPDSTPAAIRRLLRRCLERNPKNRLHDIADARIELAEALSRPDESASPALPEVASSRKFRWWQFAAGAAVALAVGLIAGRSLQPRPELPPLVQAIVETPPGAELVTTGGAPGPVVVSPDGSQLAFTARDEGGEIRLYVHALASGTTKAIPGSEAASYPFWSPDSRSLGFFNGRQLLRVEIGAGSPQPLTVAGAARGGSWGASGVIVYAPSYDSALLQIPASGGQPSPASALDATRSEGTHRFPSFLPDGRHFLFETRNYTSWIGTQGEGVFAGSIDDPAERAQLLPSASNAMYAAGRLLFVRNGTLWAQRFDPARLALSGPVSSLVQDVRFDRRYSLGVFSATAGVLALQHGARQDETELVWLDRTGRRLERFGVPAIYDGVDLSPDGSKAAVSITDPATSRNHLEIVDLVAKRSTRLTLDDGDDSGAVFSPDGSRVLFIRTDEQGIGLWTKPVDGATAERRFRPASPGELLYPLSWSPDGERILVTSLPGGTLPSGFWTLSASGTGDPERYTDSRGIGDIGWFSPDGRWVLFDANEGTSQGTYLARFPDTGGRWALPDKAATYSRWTRGGREIVYVSESTGQLTALPVDLSGPSPRFGTPQSLFGLAPSSVHGESWDIAADGERILAQLPVEHARPEPYTLILNWERLLENR